MSTDASTDRGPQPGEPDIPCILITSCHTGGHGRRLHIPDTDGEEPVCEHELQLSDEYWKVKRIETHPPSWREERWCENCLEWWAEFREGRSDGVERHRRALRAFLGVSEE